MKPEINLALINAAQEIIGRFSPLIEDEYERSRLGSWGALVLISAMKFNDAASSLEKENEDIIHWLNPDRDDLKKMKEEGYVGDDKTFDQLEKNNQLLRHKINQKMVNLEIDKDKKALKEVYALMRSMHQRRKVSDFIGILQQSES